jgi:hypothetical protein
MFWVIDLCTNFLKNGFYSEGLPGLDTCPASTSSAASDLNFEGMPPVSNPTLLGFVSSLYYHTIQCLRIFVSLSYHIILFFLYNQF